jgi:hypothetical protein
MISLNALTILVTIALVFASATPLILIALVYRDWKNGKLW